MNDIGQSGPDFSGTGPVEYSPAEVSSHDAVRRWSASDEARILAIPGVTSIGLGVGPSGSEACVIGVVDAGVAAQLPSELGGLPVVVNITGEVDAPPQQ